MSVHDNNLELAGLSMRGMWISEKRRVWCPPEEKAAQKERSVPVQDTVS